MSATETEVDGLSAVDLTDETYEVVQSLIRNKYEAYDEDGNLVFRGKQKLFKLKEEFPFVGPDDEPLFTVNAQGMLDVAGNYTLVDEQTDEPVVVLDNDFSIFVDEWTIREPDSGEVVATIETDSMWKALGRNFIPYVGPLIPHGYDVEDADGDRIGSIEGQFSLKDRYQVSVDRDADVPRDAVVTAAMVIDAIQGN